MSGNAKNETTRLALASAVLLGSAFRLQVLDRAREKFRAPPFERDLDLPLLIRFCDLLERRETRYELGFVALGLMAVVGILMLESVAIVLLAMMGLLALQFVKSGQERYDIAPQFRRDAFDLDAFRSKLGETSVPELERNVVVYSGYSPFWGSVGAALGGWSFAVDVGRSRRDNLGEHAPGSFDTTELYRAIDSGVARLQIAGVRVRDRLFVSGVELHGDERFLPTPHRRPVQAVPADVVAEFVAGHDRRVRHYREYEISDWGGEFVLTYYLRCRLDGNNLFVELSRFVLLPLGERYRAVDAMHLYSTQQNLTWALGTALVTVISVVTAPVSLLGKVSRASQQGSVDKQMRREIVSNPLFDYGAPQSLREWMASPTYPHYFLHTDKEMYDKALERQILDTIVDFLEAHNVDISDIKTRQATILNQGIIVQGGGITAQSVAVGQGARASVLERLGMRKSQPVAAPVGGAA